MAGNLLHYGAVRLRVTGDGSLDMSLIGLDGVYTKSLKALTMSTAPGREPLTLTNFINQKARLKIETDDINEFFSIDKIVIYAKPVYAQYAGS